MRDRRSRSHPDHEGIAMHSQAFRRAIITKPIFSWARGVLPAMSDTEREALEAGDVWWDADLFTGNPDWSKLLANAPATLTPEEQAFLNGPVDELCAMLDRSEERRVGKEWSARRGAEARRKRGDEKRR